MRLSTTTKNLVRKLVNFPRYGPVGFHDPQQEVDVWLRGPGEPIDVTHNNVVVALRPFTIGVMFDRSCSPPLNGDQMRLCMHERHGSKRLLGAIHLRLVRIITLAEHRFFLFETSHCENYCVPNLSLRLYYLQAKRRAALKQRKNPYNFQMTQTDLHCSFVFYICPRPVVLVTVEDKGAGNIFPMDLIGPTDSPWYSMALRSSSPAVRMMQQSGRMALASMPFTCRDVVYELGKHHRQPGIDWGKLPLRTVRSPLFGLRVPEVALKVKEVSVKESYEVGSHVLFITSTECETIPEHMPGGAEGLQMFHSYGSGRGLKGGAASILR